MKRWLLLVAVGGVLGSYVGPVQAEKVELKLKHPEGRTVEYKNKYRFEYFSNRAELIVMQNGSMRVIVESEWRSNEKVTKPEALPNEEIAEGVVGLQATVNKAASAAIFLGEKQTYEQYPMTFEMFDDRTFKWRMTPECDVQKFETDFPAYRIERRDLITDLYQAWVPAMSPVLPDKPVGEGDTWTGERAFERRFFSMDMMGRKSLTGIKSTYHVKEIKERKGRIEVKIGEERKVEYKGWLDVSSASLFLHGSGIGEGEWVIDVTNGVVLEHKMHMDVDKPTVIKAGEKEPLADIHAELKIDIERKLQKIKK
ncbi:MAG: hypothetical protein HOE48_08070 [Candidatus Latescibacteria bacterium]|jgi:hypothetical protein|nr:hypothetical protein [Candidatus Latescibacterota bacterium]MBT4137855.1 hypothetical protein [Candidatus Latescibacterota bacterium]